MTESTKRRVIQLLECIKRDVEADKAPLNDTWWLSGASGEPSALHITIYEEALDLLDTLTPPRKDAR